MPIPEPSISEMVVGSEGENSFYALGATYRIVVADDVELPKAGFARPKVGRSEKLAKNC